MIEKKTSRSQYFFKKKTHALLQEIVPMSFFCTKHHSALVFLKKKPCRELYDA